MTFGKSLKLCTRVKHPKKWKWSPKPSVMLNSKPFCKRIQRHFAAILAWLQRNSENRSTSKRIIRQIMFIGADCKLRSSLPIGHQLSSLSILSRCTIKHRIQNFRFIWKAPVIFLLIYKYLYSLLSVQGQKLVKC